MKVQVSDKLSCWKCNEPCPIAEEKNGMVSVISKPRFHTPQVHICQQGKSLGIRIFQTSKIYVPGGIF